MASKIYKFFLDNTEYTDSVDWSKAKLGWKRLPDDFHAINLKYVTQLEFVEDAYDYILTRLNTNGQCSRIELRIHYFNGTSYDQFYEGYLVLAQMEHDEWRKVFRIPAEDNSGISVLQENFDTEINIAQTTFTKGGLPLTIPSRVIAVRNYNSNATVNRTGYFFTDLLKGVLDYIFDNTIDITSTLFSANPPTTRVVQQILFNTHANIIGAGSLIFTYQNYFGEQFTVTAALDGATS